MNDFPHSEDGVGSNKELIAMRLRALDMQQHRQEAKPVSLAPCPRFLEDTNEEGYWL